MVHIKGKSENTSQAVIEAAYSLFAEQGFHASSMREIANRAGISLGTIYNHFENKEQIFDKVLLEKHPYHQVLAAMQSATGETLEDFIRNVAYLMSAEIGKHPEFLQLLFIELNEFRGRHAPILAQTICSQFLSFLQRIEGPQGQLRDLPPRVIAFSFAWLLLAYYVGETAIDPNGSLSDHSGKLEQYLEIFLHGIRVSPEPRTDKE